MTSDNPFLKPILAEKQGRTMAEANLPPGYKLVTMSEGGVHLDASETFAKSRKIHKKPTATPEGFAAFERQSLATHNRIEAEGDAILVLVMQGHPIGMQSHRDRLNAWREGRLTLPDLATYLGMQPLTPAGHAPLASVQRRETNSELESRLARQREERRTGVRLERPGHIQIQR